MSSKKVLSVFSLVMINIIAVDSIRSLATNAALGLSLVSYYLLAAVCFMIPLALVGAELAAAWPEEGGIYIWIREAFGKPWGLFTAWIQWIYNVVWYPSIASVLVMTVLYLINPTLAEQRWYMLSIIIPVFWLITGLNCLGMRVANWVTVIGAILGVLLPLGLLIVFSFFWVTQDHPVAISLSLHNLIPNLNNLDNLGLLTTLAFSLLGLEMSAIHATDVNNPQRDYPKALLISVLVILISLIGGSLAIALVIPVSQLNLSLGLIETFKLFFHSYQMDWMLPIMACFIVIGGVSAISAWLLGPSRCLMVASRDKVAPEFWSRVNQQGAPVGVLVTQAILFTFFSGAYVLFKQFNSAYWLLNQVTGQLALLIYMVLFLAAIRLRYKFPKKTRAFMVPGKHGMTCIGLLGFLFCVITFCLGFIPPKVLHIQPVYLYETMLIGSILLFSTIPFVMYYFWQKS